MAGSAVAAASTRAIADAISVVVIDAEQALHHHLHLTVTVQVAHRAVVGLILDDIHVAHILGRLQRDGNVWQLIAGDALVNEQRVEGRLTNGLLSLHVAHRGRSQAAEIVARHQIVNPRRCWHGRRLIAGGVGHRLGRCHPGQRTVQGSSQTTIEMKGRIPCVGGQHAPADEQLARMLLIAAQRGIGNGVDGRPHHTFVQTLWLWLCCGCQRTRSQGQE